MSRTHSIKKTKSMKVSVAKFSLFNLSPFFGSILFNLPVEEGDKVTQTLAVDGVSLHINPKYWDSLPGKQQIGTLTHEVCHLMLSHIWRMGARIDIAVDPATGQMIPLWNLATDYAVNLLVTKELGRDFLPKGALYDTKYTGWSAEKIYEDLQKQIPKMSKQDLKDMMGKHGSTDDHGQWGKKKGKDAVEAQGKMKQLIAQAMEVAKSKGKEPEFAKRLLQEMEPKEDWRKVLMDYVQPYMNDYNFQRPDRRFLEEEFFLPDIKEGQYIDWIAVAIDTSGSIGQNEMNHFIAEIKSILGSYDKVKIKLTFCDAEATDFVELDEYDKSKIKPVGGGGTDFKPVFDLIKKEGSAPQALLYFTDMMGDFPSRAPHYDTIWVSTTGRDYKAPFGKQLPYNV